MTLFESLLKNIKAKTLVVNLVVIKQIKTVLIKEKESFYYTLHQVDGICNLPTYEPLMTPLCTNSILTKITKKNDFLQKKK